MSEIECKCCGIEFDPNSRPHRDVGYFNECFTCGLKTDIEKQKDGFSRHVGIQGGEGINKSSNISIIRNPTPSQAAGARYQNCGGYSARLPIGNTANSFLDKDEAVENLNRRSQDKYEAEQTKYDKRMSKYERMTR